MASFVGLRMILGVWRITLNQDEQSLGVHHSQRRRKGGVYETFRALARTMAMVT